MDYAQFMRLATIDAEYQAIAYLRLTSDKVQLRIGDKWVDTEIPVTKVALFPGGLKEKE